MAKTENIMGQNLREWAKDKSPLFAHTAIGWVKASENFHNLIKGLHEANVIDQLSRKDIQEWLESCKQSRKTIKYFLTFFPAKYGPIPILKFKPLKLLTKAAYSGNKNRLKKMADQMEGLSEKDYEKIAGEINNLMRNELESLIVELTLKSKNPANDEDCDITWREYFIFNNHLLSLVEYGECFTILYRRARLGDYDAISKLIRLDPLLLKDHFINNHFITAKPSIVSKLKNAYNNPLEYHTKASKVKVSICGLISALTEVNSNNGKIITPNELRQLFDAYAMDVCHKPADEELPEEYDAFRKAVKRHHKLWLPILTPKEIK